MIRDSEKMFFVVILLTRVSSSTEVKDTRSLASSLDLQCPTCDRIHCTPRRPSQLRCKGGIVRGVCDCCPVCAKTREEACGGHWNYLGRCDVGLACDPNKNQVMDDFTLDDGRHVTEIRRWMPEGRCRKVQELNDGPQLLQPVKCYPACSHQFCSRNPKEICSAADVADRKQSCQGDCQHTSCSACRFMKPEIECVRCIKDDWECLKKFGRCIRKTHCHRNDFPCKLNKYEDGYKFRCVVPQCPSN